MKGEEKTWGQITVFVPEGFTFGQGSITGVDDEDETQCYLKGDTSLMFDYFWIVVNSEEQVKNNIEMTKSVNKAEDAVIKAGDDEWSGCHYVYSTLSGDVDCGMVYRVIDGVAFQVSFCGHAMDSAEMEAVLSSVRPAK